MKVEGLDFSDTQGDKGAADRIVATAKNHIRMYVNEGNDVTNAHQMKDAFLSHGGVEGVRVAVADSLEESVNGELQAAQDSRHRWKAHRLESLCCWKWKATRRSNELR